MLPKIFVLLECSKVYILDLALEPRLSFYIFDVVHWCRLIVFFSDLLHFTVLPSSTTYERLGHQGTQRPCGARGQVGVDQSISERGFNMGGL